MEDFNCRQQGSIEGEDIQNEGEYGWGAVIIILLGLGVK